MEKQKTKSTGFPVLWIITGILFSGICWYFSNGLRGDFWFLMWIAPVPVMIISFNTNGMTSFVASFSAYLIGRLSWFAYLVSVATIIPAIILTLILPFVFALILVAVRRVAVRTRTWYSVFAFPALYTAFEFLLMKYSADGTAGSIAYSQSDFLPLAQIASVAGLYGITFLVTLIPSALAVGWYYHMKKIRIRHLITVTICLVAAVLVFGIIRINTGGERHTIRAGLAVLDENAHFIADSSLLQKDKPVAEKYAEAISTLASQGAGIIVLPERAVNMDSNTAPEIIRIFSDAARKNHVYIVAGYTNLRGDHERNSALVLDDEGREVAGYDKIHLVTRLERQFRPGKEPGYFEFHTLKAGTAICKDLDFSGYIRKYGKGKISFLCIPAWDFGSDDWLHSRMAIMRGIENGFSEIRSARTGTLTISDCLGRVNNEANSAHGKACSLIGNVSLQTRDTFYNRFGNWFGILNLISAFGFAILGIRFPVLPDPTQK
jgi:apolipoprotein N-acyltransferase